MNILYNIVRNAMFGIILVCQVVPIQGFWPQTWCARLSSAFATMPQRVKNSSIFKKFGWFSTRPQVMGNKVSRWGFYSIPAIPASLYHSEKDKDEPVPNSLQCPKKIDIPVDRTKTVALACSVLSELKIKINTSNPLKQIMGLTTDQQMRAFDYLQNLFADEDDESELATLYSVMQYLKAPRVQYQHFFDIIGNNLGDCRRDALVKEIRDCKSIPKAFKQEFDKFMTPTFAWEYAKACMRNDGPPKELHNVLRKIPCSTSSWQAPERGLKNKEIIVPMHATRRGHEIAERLLQLYGSKNY